jgi:hypothetical protein
MHLSYSVKKHKPHDIPDLSILPEGQHRAVIALIGGEKAVTYGQAADKANMSLGTLFTHLRRVRHNHPELYETVCTVRLSQLEERHKEALQRAEEHSYDYFRRKRNYAYYRVTGRWPWEKG